MTTTTHTTGTRDEWLAASEELEKREKELTRLSDELARKRRELPWVPLDKEYSFETTDGTKTLAELFDGRSQLIVYHFMFGPEESVGCVGCSFVADHFNPAIPHVNARDVTVVVVSRGPLEKLQEYRRRMGWDFEWVSSLGSDFNYDFGVSQEPTEEWSGESPGLSAFALEDGVVHHTYSSRARGLEILDVPYHLLDRAPLGRQEEGLEQPGSWWRRHDEY